MSNNLRQQIYNNLNLKGTDELIEIWTTNNRTEWSETAFDVVKEILDQRLGEIPPQNKPVTEDVEQENDDTYDENTPLDKSDGFTNLDNAPAFYKPRDVLWINLWLNRISVVAIVITILVSIPEFTRMQRIVLSYYFMGNMDWSFVSWLIAIVVGGLATALECFIFYFSLKALASILKILMAMEFNSRVTN